MISRHALVTARLLLETLGLFALLAVLAIRAALSGWAWLLYPPVLLAQAFTLQRIYIVGHEAAHKKLVPANRWWNDTLGQVALLPILVPVVIYRKVHYFHHGFNRKDHQHSALDVFVSPWPVTPVVQGFFYLVWYLGIFAGGYFLHSVASIIIFLFIPTDQARKISPAFHNWTARDRMTAWAQFLACVGFHALTYALDSRLWLYALGLPFLAFAWVWSLLVYIFHYATTIGDDVRYNVRRLERHWFFSWLLMNFNEHATHHIQPTIPWYELPENRKDLPAAFAAKNQTTGSFLWAILQQVKGPTVVYAKDTNPTPHLFVRWED